MSCGFPTGLPAVASVRTPFTSMFRVVRPAVKPPYRLKVSKLGIPRSPMASSAAMDTE